jgi:hypothetical protein
MRAKHKNDGNHGKRGYVSGNPRYCRAKLGRLLDGYRVGLINAKKLVTMGRN